MLAWTVIINTQLLWRGEANARREKCGPSSRSCISKFDDQIVNGGLSSIRNAVNHGSAIEHVTRSPREGRLGTVRRRALRGIWTEHIGDVRRMGVQRRRFANGNVVELDANPIVFQKDLHLRNDLRAILRPGCDRKDEVVATPSSTALRVRVIAFLVGAIACEDTQAGPVVPPAR